MGIVGREKEKEITPVDPVFEIYYYSIAPKANMKLLQSEPRLTCRNLRGEGGES